MFKIKVNEKKNPKIKLQILLSLLVENLVLIKFEKKDGTLRDIYTYLEKNQYYYYKDAIETLRAPKDFSIKVKDCKISQYRTVKTESIKSITVIEGKLDKNNPGKLIKEYENEDVSLRDQAESDVKLSVSLYNDFHAGMIDDFMNNYIEDQLKKIYTKGNYVNINGDDYRITEIMEENKTKPVIK